MVNGYYEERASIIEQENEDISFDFMANDDIGGALDNSKYNLHDCLHGYCDIFAAVLHEIFGYKIEYLYGPDGGLVHSYAIATDKDKQTTYYIDVRGICDDWDTFIEEFDDWIESHDRSELDIRLYNIVEHGNEQKSIAEFCKKAIMLQKSYYKI